MTGILATVTALLLSVGILLIGHGLQLSLIPLYADNIGWAPETIGYIGSAYFTGFVVGCLTVPRLVARAGHIRAFGVLAATATAALLVVGIFQEVIVWIIARFGTGWCFAGLYMVIESWLNERTGPEQRGDLAGGHVYRSGLYRTGYVLPAARHGGGGDYLPWYHPGGVDP